MSDNFNECDASATDVIARADALAAIAAAAGAQLTANAALAGGFDGATWQDMSAARVVGVNYTNTTGRALQVNASVTSGVLSAVRIIVDGIEAARNDSTATTAAGVCATVPNGGVYRITNSAGVPIVAMWAELRV